MVVKQSSVQSDVTPNLNIRRYKYKLLDFQQLSQTDFVSNRGLFEFQGAVGPLKAIERTMVLYVWSSHIAEYGSTG